MLLVLFSIASLGVAQEKKSVTISAAITQLDTNSIVPESFTLTGLNPDQFQVDFAAGTLSILDSSLVYPIHVEVAFRSFPFNFSKEYRHKEMDLITDNDRVYNPFRSELNGKNDVGLGLGDLEKRGSVSRGITVGNAQSLSVNSSLNLQLSGRLNERFSLLAAIADDNIPIQPEGNTQQLQDFDQVYLQIFDPKNKITTGDFQAHHNQGYFLRFNKRLQGGRYESLIFPVSGDSSKQIKSDVSGAVSRGKFARQTIQGIEGNQGPYRLTGSEGERFVVVLSGTERIYLDGRLLVRGQENDYIINYNTAELTFTAKVPITKDRRIVAEYQYSDRNYARSLIYAGSEYTSEKLDLNVGIYSEQDSKNQPLQQDLTDAQKNVLRTIGDSLDQAVASSVDTIPFSENQILYKLVDTTYYDPVRDDTFSQAGILVFSSDPELANQQATFSEVGPGQGNYVAKERLAFGTVYQWTPPIGGLPQGDHEPVVLLVTPKQRQMVQAAATYRINENIEASVEWAGSQNDINTFSTADKSDDLGMATKVHVAGVQPISSNWRAIAEVDYEFVQEEFGQIERFRDVEFDRDWNIRGVTLNENQNIWGARVGLANKSKLKTMYGIKSFVAGNAFSGIQNGLDFLVDDQLVQANYSGSLINQSGEKIEADFYQHNSTISIPLWKLKLGFKDDFEQNKRYHPWQIR